jgi:hypothetical protein
VGDHAGHLLGDRFYGVGNRQNLVPMKRTVNLSDFKVRFENLLADWIQKQRDKGKAWLVYVTIGVVYDDSLVGAERMRPVRFSAWATGITGSQDSLGRIRLNEENVARSTFSNS